MLKHNVFSDLGSDMACCHLDSAGQSTYKGKSRYKGNGFCLFTERKCKDSTEGVNTGIGKEKKPSLKSAMGKTKTPVKSTRLF